MVVLLIAAGLAFFLWLNSFVKRTIEQQTTQTLSLDTRVGGVSLDLLGHRLHLDHFRIASPAGFSPEPLLVVTGGEMGMTYDQLHGEPVHVASITLRPRLLVEQRGGKLNFRAMVEQLPAAGRPMRLMIDEVTVQDATVVLRNIPGLAREVTVLVPTFVLHNVGSGEGSSPGGRPCAKVVMQLVAALSPMRATRMCAAAGVPGDIEGGRRSDRRPVRAEAQRQNSCGPSPATPAGRSPGCSCQGPPAEPRPIFSPGSSTAAGPRPPPSTHPTTAPPPSLPSRAGCSAKPCGPFGSKKP